MALAADTATISWTDAPLRERGISPRPVSDAIAEMAHSSR
jgi:hypothetical protein